MFKKIRNAVKNEKGLTLIELLAVVVILGIIAAIAVPSIGGLIDNSKKDAHVANATQMISSAKTYMASNNNKTFPVVLSLQDMIGEGLIDEMEDPDGGKYTLGTAGKKDGSYVEVTKDTTNTNKFIYTVKLSNGTRGITGTQSELERENVK